MFSMYFSTSIGFLFTLAGIFILYKKGFSNIGLGSTLFFSLIFVFGIYRIFIFYKNKKIALQDFIEIQIELNRKFVVDSKKFYTTILFLIPVGLSCILMGNENYFIFIIGILLILLFFIILILAWMGILGTDYIIFEKSGIRRGNRKGSYLIEWNNISTNSNLGFYQNDSNPAIFIIVNDDFRLLKTIEVNTEKNKKYFEKLLNDAIIWNGCNSIIIGEKFGLNTIILWKFILQNMQSSKKIL